MEAVEFNRLRWQCRRGMLENDLVLDRFLLRHGEALEGARLEAFKALLEYSDNDLWDVVSGRAECRDPSLSEVVALLRAC
ncbi:MAG: succinate dehydrogenase assembly factor 2 family protein [Betaproteobacteria bacterium]|nr:succinate dehydrogenase assembly factor 2 family protein [Betaproteobacteria bacterium]